MNGLAKAARHVSNSLNAFIVLYLLDTAAPSHSSMMIASTGTCFSYFKNI